MAILLARAVLGRVGQQLGGAEVGDGLDRGGGPDRDARPPARPGSRCRRPARRGRRPARCRAPAGGSRGPGCAARRARPWRPGARRRPARGRPRRRRLVASPSFSRAMPRFMASVASRICAPSCRSRSSRRSRAAESSTASARLSSRSWTRCASRPGPSRPRISRPSAAMTALVTHGAASSIAAPAAAAANVPGRVARGTCPRRTSERRETPASGSAGPPAGGCGTPPQQRVAQVDQPADPENTAYSPIRATGSLASR